MPSKQEEIKGILNDLLRLEDIHACMLARKEMEGIFPPMEKFDDSVTEVWQILKETMGEFFEVIEKYSEHGLDTVHFELQEHTVMFFVIPGSNMALVAIIPSLANRGLLEVEMENAKREVKDAMGE